MLRLLLLLGILARVSHAYTVSGFQPRITDINLSVNVGGTTKYRYQLVKSQQVTTGYMDVDFITFRESATYADEERVYGPYYLHMYEFINGRYHLKSISDVSGPRYADSDKGLIVGAEQFGPDLLLLEGDGGEINVITRNSQGMYVVEGSLGGHATPIFSLPDDIAFRRTISGENITYMYVDAALEYELKKEAGVWSWGYSSRPNPPLSNSRSFLLNENEFIYVSEIHNPLVIKIYRFNGTDWNTVLDYEEFVRNTGPTKKKTCSLVEVREGEAYLTTSRTFWGNSTALYNSAVYDYTIEKTNETWSVSKMLTRELYVDPTRNYTDGSTGSSCSGNLAYPPLSDNSRLFMGVEFSLFIEARFFLELYRIFPNGTRVDLWTYEITNIFDPIEDVEVLSGIDKVAFTDYNRSVVEIYDLSNGGYALEDTLYINSEGSPVGSSFNLDSVGDSLTIEYNDTIFAVSLN